MTLLNVSNLSGGYGPIQVLFDVNLTIGSGEVVALVGRNGVGKTTTIKTITGALAATGGDITFDATSLIALPGHSVARLGVGLAPEGRQVFSNLTVEENLQLAQHSGPQGEEWTVASVFALFPRLKERRKNLAGTLSGGEQQKLAIARALVTNPTLLILDEATEGLAPLVRQEIWSCLQKISRTGMSALVVDKNLHALSRIASKFVVMSKGRTVWEGEANRFVTNQELRTQHLGI